MDDGGGEDPSLAGVSAISGTAARAGNGVVDSDGLGTNVLGEGGLTGALVGSFFLTNGVVASPVRSFHRNADKESLSIGFGATSPVGLGTGGDGRVDGWAAVTVDPNRPP